MEKLPVVKIFNSRTEAEIAKSYLASLGIKTHIFSDDAGQMYTPLQTVRGVELMTSQKDLKKAQEFLSEKNK